MTKHSRSQGVRRRMAPDERREAILDAAHGLFMEHGCEAVTVADVLTAAGISKGGFYHHFRAKEDLLTGIVERMTEQSLAAARTVSGQSVGNSLTRLKAFLTSLVRWNVENVAEMRFFAVMLTKPGNDILYRRIFDATAAVIVPVLEELIDEGVADGMFDVIDARLAAEMIVGLSHGRRQVLDEALAMTGAGDLELATKHLNTRMQAEGATCDRLLGLSPGTIPLSHPEDYRRMLAGLTGIDTLSAEGERSAEPEITKGR